MKSLSHSIENSWSKQFGETCSQKFDCALVKHAPAFESIFLLSATFIVYPSAS